MTTELQVILSNELSFPQAVISYEYSSGKEVRITGASFRYQAKFLQDILESK